ncbi:MAG: archaeal heat shock protein Hsp20 [Desulfurococcaceae archaeon]
MVDDMLREMEEFMDHVLREFAAGPEELRRRGYKVYGPYIYGYKITMGPDGRPIIEEFGNVRRSRGRPMISEEREPLVDVFETDEEVKVVVEMPGVEKDKINVSVGEDKRTLIIRASDTDRKYYKEVELPAEVDPSSAKASYRNGVLEVVLRKSRKEGKGYVLKVE